MFKIKDKVVNQRGNVGEVVSVTSKGCKLLFKVDFGRVQRFFEAKELTWDQLYVALLNLYHQRLLEIQAVKDMMQAENIELEFDIPSDIELAQLAITLMANQDDEDDDEIMPFYG